MAESVMIRPSRWARFAVVFCAIVIALDVFFIIGSALVGPANLHCTKTSCWLTMPEPYGDETQHFTVAHLHHSRVERTGGRGAHWTVDDGEDEVELGEPTRDRAERAVYDNLSHSFAMFLADPTDAGFDATYTATGSYVATFGSTLLVALALLLRRIRGWKTRFEVDRARGELRVRRSPLMFREREQWRSLQATVVLEPRRGWLFERRYLIISDGMRPTLEIRAPGKRDYAAEIQALLQQAA